MTRSASIFAMLVCLFWAAAAECDEPAFHLNSGDVVAFLGATNMVNLQQAGYVETLLTAAYPTAQVRFRDLAWEGDTVFRQGTVIERWRQDKFGDLRAQLELNRITVVFAQFGQCEVVRAPEGVSDFVAAYSQLLSILKENDHRVVIITPIPFEKAGEHAPNLTPRNRDLAKYVAAMEQLAADRGCVFVNLFSNFRNEAAKALTKNGYHVKPSAQGRVALAIGRQLSLPVSNETSLSTLRDAVVRKHELWVSYWRPANWKCLYGDDGERQFGKASANGLTLRQEWQQLPGLVAKAEERIWTLAARLEGKSHNE